MSTEEDARFLEELTKSHLEYISLMTQYNYSTAFEHGFKHGIEYQKNKEKEEKSG